jgi:hypothetical protein
MGVSSGLKRNCDAGVTQNLPSLTKLTSLTVLAGSDSITYVFAMQSGEFGLQVRPPGSGRPIFFTFRTAHCDSLMRNPGRGFSRRKLGQNLGKESTPNRVKSGVGSRACKSRRINNKLN